MPEASTRFDKYELIRRLAVGGMGEIFLARQTGVAGFGRLVIIKTLLPNLVSQEGFLEQFLDEARVAATLNHPNIVAILEVGVSEGTYFIAMEYIPGVDLDTLSRLASQAKRPIPPRVIAEIIRNAAQGLDFAHHAKDDQGNELKLVHRDISPHNIMVRTDGGVKVVDFGVAKSANRVTKTEGNLVKGKLRYMSPEQIRGQALDPRSDQFSLGTTMWELFAGKALFPGENVIEAARQIIASRIPPLMEVAPGTSPELDRIVQRALARNPEQRYKRLADMAHDLQKYVEATGGSPEKEVTELVDALAGSIIAERTQNLPRTSTEPNLSAVPPRPGMLVGTPALHCKECNAELLANAKFCPECGARLTPAAGGISSPPHGSTAGVPWDAPVSMTPPQMGPPPIQPPRPAPRSGPQFVFENGQQFMVFDGGTQAQDEEPLELAIDSARREDLVYGREVEMNAIRSTLEAATAGGCPSLLLLGEPGCGKTRLLKEAEKLAKQMGMLVVWAKGARAGVPVALDIFRQWVLDTCAKVATRPLAMEDLYTRPVAYVLNELSHLGLPKAMLTRLAQVFDGTNADDVVDVGEHRQRMEATLAYFLAEISNRQRICLIVDDVHRGDPGSLQIMSELPQRLRAVGGAIIATGTGDLRILPNAQRVNISKLSNEDMVKVAETELRRGSLPPVVGQWLGNRCRGNPFLVINLTHMLVETRVLCTNGGVWFTQGTVEEAALPDRTDYFTLARLNHVSKDAQALVKLCAVAGDMVNSALMMVAVGKTMDVHSALRELVDCATLAPVGTSSRLFEFTQGMTREHIQAKISAEQRKSLRADLAISCEQSGISSRPDTLEIMARLFSAAEDEGKSAHYAALAANKLLSQGAILAAADMFRRAVNMGIRKAQTSPPFSEMQCAALLKLAGRCTACLVQVVPDEAPSVVTSVMDVIPPKLARNERVEALRQQAIALQKLHRNADAAAVMEAAMEMAGEEVDPDLRGAVAAADATLMQANGSWQGALVRLGNAVKLMMSKPASPSPLLPRVINQLGTIYARSNQMDLARRSFDHARLLANRTQQHSAEVQAMLWIAKLHMGSQDLANAFSMLNEAEALATQAADPALMARVLLEKGRTMMLMGNPASAQVLHAASAWASVAGLEDVYVQAAQSMQKVLASSSHHTV